MCVQAVTGHEACVEALLQHSATLLVRDCRGRSPLHLAASCGHIGVLGGLLQAAQSLDAVPVVTDNRGYTPLHWACYNGTTRSAFLWRWWLFAAFYATEMDVCIVRTELSRGVRVCHSSCRCTSAFPHLLFSFFPFFFVWHDCIYMPPTSASLFS